MKCPKCHYLGFETGDRCKNCGYDFSLIAASSDEDPEVDLTLQLTENDSSPADWLDKIDRALGQSDAAAPGELALPERDIEASVEPDVAPPPPSPRAPEPPLPLFGSAVEDDDDEPLIRVPAAPRPPLAVRRTPDVPRLRAVPRAPRRAEPVLEFSEDEPESAANAEPKAAAVVTPAPGLDTPPMEPGTAMARVAATAIDHLILVSIDLAVLYFTLRMAGLTMNDWALLPAAPFLTFLMLLKLSYFSAFTAVGGQTIGKMAARIRVVTEDDATVDGARAVQRTVAAAFSTLVLGLGFIPALLGTERRALHDRVAHTRVVALRSA
jgi:uncharacterized RDD family membrane protein YckC